MDRLSCRPLLSAVGRVLTALLVVGLMAGCSGSKEELGTTDTSAVTASFTNYTAAVNAKNGPLAASLMSQASRDYYDQMRTLALDASPATLQKQKVIDQITVLSMRAGLTPQVLRTADESALIDASIKQGLISQNASAGISLKQISIQGNVAKAQLVQAAEPGTEQPSYPVQFELENDRWCFDVTSLLGPAEAEVIKAAKVNRMTTKVLVQTVMETRVGKAKAKAIWTPIGRG